jgi:hypothetical protein
MQSPRQTSEADAQPVVAPTPAQNDASVPTSAASPTAASPTAAAATKRDEDNALFGPALLLTGEDRDAWEKLHAAICSTVEPVDIFERLWTRDIVDHEWNILRLRRLSAGLISATVRRGLENVLRPLKSHDTGGFGDSGVEILAWQFTRQDKEAVKEVNALLEAAGLSWDAVLAQTMTINVESIERFDRMCTIAEARRDATLREIDRRRTSFGERVRRALDQLKPGEFFQSEPSGWITVGRYYDQPA